MCVTSSERTSLCSSSKWHRMGLKEKETVGRLPEHQCKFIFDFSDPVQKKEDVNDDRVAVSEGMTLANVEFSDGSRGVAPLEADDWGWHSVATEQGVAAVWRSPFDLCKPPPPASIALQPWRTACPEQERSRAGTSTRPWSAHNAMRLSDGGRKSWNTQG